MPPRPAPLPEPRARSRAKALGGLAAALLAACDGGAGGGGPPGDGRPPVRVEVVEAGSQEIPRAVAAVGSLETPEPTTVAAEVSGRIVALDVPEGEAVAEGHVLARIEPDAYRAAAAERRARYAGARDRLRRVERLHAEGVASEQALDDARSAYDAARAALAEAETRLRKTRIRAPFAGRVGLRPVSIGQYVEPGAAIVSLTRADPLELRFGIPQRFAARVKVGQTVHAVVGRCEARFEGRVTAIDPRVDPVTRTLRLEAAVPDPEGVLAPGMAVRLRLVTGSIPDAVVVPQEAVVRQGTKHLVYVVDEEGAARQREVALGEFFVDGVHVREGVSAGERVVVAGQQKLRPGARVEPVPYEATDNPLLDLGGFGPEGECGL